MSNKSETLSHINQQPLSVADAILARRSVRHYLPIAVPTDLLDQLLNLSLEAPTSWNLQDRHLVVVQGRDGLAALTAATGGQPQPQEAPIIVVFLADLSARKRDCSLIWEMARNKGAWTDEFAALIETTSDTFQMNLERRGLLREYSVKDAMIAASFFMLAASSIGLATSPMNGWDEMLVKRAIGIEDQSDIAVALLVSLGYAANAPLHPGRQDRSKNIFFERFIQ